MASAEDDDDPAVKFARGFAAGWLGRRTTWIWSMFGVGVALVLLLLVELGITGLRRRGDR